MRLASAELPAEPPTNCRHGKLGNVRMMAVLRQPVASKTLGRMGSDGDQLRRRNPHAEHRAMPFAKTPEIVLQELA